MRQPVYQYYKVVDDRQEWLGVRYFKSDSTSDTVVQVCRSTGNVKKGKSNTFVVYIISRLTLNSNYLAMRYADICTKDEYEKAFKEVFNYLK